MAALTVTGLTFDTAALIALERGDKRVSAVLLAADHEGLDMTVPAAALIKWWRTGAPATRPGFRVVPLANP